MYYCLSLRTLSPLLHDYFSLARRQNRNVRKLALGCALVRTIPKPNTLPGKFHQGSIQRVDPGRSCHSHCNRPKAARNQSRIFSPSPHLCVSIEAPLNASLVLRRVPPPYPSDGNIGEVVVPLNRRKNFAFCISFIQLWPPLRVQSIVLDSKAWHCSQQCIQTIFIRHYIKLRQGASGDCLHQRTLRINGRATKIN